jgi:hypothetical protein
MTNFHRTPTLFCCACLIVGAFGSSCSRTEVPPGTDLTSDPTNQLLLQASRAHATALMSKVHQGMTFDQVSKVIPISERNLLAISHGGAQFTVGFGDYAIWLRFDRPRTRPEHLPTKEELRDCRLNLPPELLDVVRPATENNNMGLPPNLRTSEPTAPR